MIARVLRPGLLTTVQDAGRPGYQRFGVVAGGAMDPFAAQLANLLAGNAADAAVLELALTGPQIQFDSETLIAWCGAEFSATLDQQPLPQNRPVRVRANVPLDFGAARRGAMAWLAIAGGINVPAVMGSRSTYLGAAIGGFQGRKLAVGDPIPLGARSTRSERLRQQLRSEGKTTVQWAVAPGRLGIAAEPGVLRAMRGPEWDWFSSEAQAAFFRDEFQVTKDTNRMGARLASPPLLLARPREMTSAAMNHGVVQVPPAGQPIILGADRQTIGGYPRIGAVATVDFSALAQLSPGTTIRFQEITTAEAHTLIFSRERDLAMVSNKLATEYF